MLREYVRNELRIRTAPEFYIYTRNISSKVNGIIRDQPRSRRSVGIRVVDDNIGVAARFNPLEAEIDVVQSILLKTDPRKIGTAEDVAQNPSLYASLSHELLHVLFSEWEIPRAIKTEGPKVAAAMKLLEEARIERLGFKVLPPMWGEALKRGQVDYVFKDLLVLDEEGRASVNAGLYGTETAVRLHNASILGLLVGRYEAGLLLDSKELFDEIFKIIELSLGDELYPQFYEVASNSSQIDISPWTTGYIDYVREARRWAELEDQITDEEGGKGRGKGKGKNEEEGDEEETEGGDPGEDEDEEGQGGDDGENGDDQGSTDNGKDGRGKDGRNKSDSKSEKDPDGKSDWEGKDHDGSKKAYSRDDGKGYGALGNYRSVHRDEAEDADLPSMIRKLLNQAETEVREVTGSKLREGVIQARQADLTKEHERQGLKEQAAKAWRSYYTGGGNQ